MKTALEDINPDLIESIKGIKNNDICVILGDLNSQDILDHNGKNLLFYAVEFQNLHATQFLIDKLDINHQSNSGNTVLHVAVSLGNLEIIKLLLKKAIDPNLKNKEGASAIFNALFLLDKDNSLEIIKVLKQYKANIDQKDNKGLSPILIAVSNTDKKTANYLAKLGAKTDYLSEESLEKILSNVISSSQAKEESKQQMLEIIREIKNQQKQNKIISPSPIETPSTVISKEEFNSITKEPFREL